MKMNGQSPNQGSSCAVDMVHIRPKTSVFTVKLRAFPPFRATCIDQSATPFDQRRHVRLRRSPAPRKTSGISVTSSPLAKDFA
jgi:hypothetical protein